MTKREYWRQKAAKYLRWHRAAMRSPLAPGPDVNWLAMYTECRHYADYWHRHGEQARAPSWYYPH
jgi:hypothetical protein